MKVNIIGKTIKITESMKEIIPEKLSKLDKYSFINDETKCDVLIKTYNEKQKAEITIRTKVGLLRAEASCSDAYMAVDKAIDKIEGQIRKMKTKIDKKHKLPAKIAMASPEPEVDETLILREKYLVLEEITREDAIMEMELLNHSFYLFKDKNNGATSVVYKRNDGGYGVIISE